MTLDVYRGRKATIQQQQQQEKIRLDVSSESSARQRIHMKNQALFSLKDKSKKLKCRLLQFLFGALRVNAKWDANTDNDTDNYSDCFSNFCRCY